MDGSELRFLHQLARLYGVETAYYDVEGEIQHASPEVLLLVLRTLGAPAERLSDARAALRERRRALWSQPLEPVAVARQDLPLQLKLRAASHLAGGTVPCRLHLEGGETRAWTCNLEQLQILKATEIEGIRYISKELVIPGALPLGYHRLSIELGGKLVEAMIISAPVRAYSDADALPGKVWGAFMPIYALHSQRSFGCGDFSDVEALTEWAAKLEGGLIGTLPFLASFLDNPFEPSPYVPASRLFWNELFLDVTRVPELKRSPAARALLNSAEVRAELQAMRSEPLVDYRRAMTLKRRVLEKLARRFFAEASERHTSFRRFVEGHPAVEDYARFRAACERRRSPWHQWPERLRDGHLKAGDYSKRAKRYHMYVQWLAHEQIGSILTKAKQLGTKLYLDLPLGVHPDGYDVWRERAIFVPDIAAGAPPDTFFTRGQNWGFPPLHPERIRAQGYRYMIACLRHLLRPADILRIDHVMGLHRLFWIPRGLEARQGVYVRYPADELYAILALESHRHRTLIVGEDLGTVPHYVRPAMARHNVNRMYVMQYELAHDPDQPLHPVAPETVASLNTHDMPSFAAFWHGLDIADRLDLSLLDEADAEREREKREAIKQALSHYFRRCGLMEGDATEQAVLEASLAHLAASSARFLLVNLEDLWLEEHPQNVPGTQTERPNWKRKSRLSLEQITQMPQVSATLSEIARLRARAKTTAE